MKGLLSKVFEIQCRANSLDQLLGELAILLGQEFSVESLEIMLLSGPESIVSRASTSQPDLVNHIRFSPQKGLTGHCLRTQELVERDPKQKHPSEIRYPGYDEDRYPSAVFSPLSAGGQAFGVLVLRRVMDWKLTSEEKSRIREVSDWVAMCISGWRSAFVAGTNANQVEALSEVTATIASSPYLEEILQLLVNVTAEQFSYRVCTVRLLDEHSQELVLRATQARNQEYQRKRSIRVGESIAGRAVVENRTIVVADVLEEKEYIGHELAVEQGLRSMICVPLSVQENVLGVLTCYTSELRAFDDIEIKALETIAQQAAFSIERAKLQVRSTLMQEMHHRVKNNLQQIVSLLRLQLRHAEYKSLESALNDSIARILAISAVHELLSREDLDRVGLKTIAENLVGHLQRSISGPSRTLTFDVRGEDVRLTMTQATQVALVINELLANAVEHGFGMEAGGEIHVNFESAGDQVMLWVSNNGTKLPADFDLAKASHLGLQIVTNLAKGLGGSFTLQDKLGWTVAELVFTRITSD